MSRELISGVFNSKKIDAKAEESVALLTEVQKTRNLLQAVLMNELEGLWTEEHGRGFSLLYPPHTSPGDDKFKVLDKFSEVMQADDERRKEMLTDLLSEMDRNSLKHREQKHANRDSRHSHPQSTSSL